MRIGMKPAFSNSIIAQLHVLRRILEYGQTRGYLKIARRAILSVRPALGDGRAKSGESVSDPRSVDFRPTLRSVDAGRPVDRARLALDQWHFHQRQPHYRRGPCTWRRAASGRDRTAVR